MNSTDPLVPRENSPGSFDAYYYATGCGHPYERNAAWMRLFQEIARVIVKEIHPHTVLEQVVHSVFSWKTFIWKGWMHLGLISQSMQSRTLTQA